MKNYNSKYVVRLTAEERGQLEKLVKTGKVAAAKRCRAQVLLKADAGPECSGPPDEQVSQALDVSVGLVHLARQAYVEEGLSAALERKPACRHRPRLLAQKLVELQIVDSISKDAVRSVLKKTSCSRG